MKTNWLANIFVWIHSVIEEADKPISLIVMVLLPFIAPLLPAIITAKSLGKFMGFESWETWIAVISFELIGYLGMIAVVGALMRLVNNKDEKKTSALKLNFGFYLSAYATYLITLLVSNAIFEWVSGAPLTRVIVILCLTVGLSVSAGILNASRIYDRDEGDDEFAIRQERREDNMKRYAMRKGINIYAQDGVQVGQELGQFSSVQGSENVYVGNWKVDRKRMDVDDLRWLSEASANEVMQKYPVGRSTAYNWINSAQEELK